MPSVVYILCNVFNYSDAGCYCAGCHNGKCSVSKCLCTKNWENDHNRTSLIIVIIGKSMHTFGIFSFTNFMKIYFP